MVDQVTEGNIDCMVQEKLLVRADDTAVEEQGTRHDNAVEGLEKRHDTVVGEPESVPDIVAVELERQHGSAEAGQVIPRGKWAGSPQDGEELERLRVIACALVSEAKEMTHDFSTRSRSYLEEEGPWRRSHSNSWAMGWGLLPAV